MAADAGRTLLPYREDHIGLTRWPLLIAVGLSVLTVALAVLAVPTSTGPIGGLTLTGCVFAGCGAAIAWVLVYTGWVLAIEIDPEQIRYGALRNADARARRGLRPSTTPYATWLHGIAVPFPRFGESGSCAGRVMRSILNGRPGFPYSNASGAAW
jgi:hypothetical protein